MLPGQPAANRARVAAHGAGQSVGRAQAAHGKVTGPGGAAALLGVAVITRVEARWDRSPWPDIHVLVKEILRVPLRLEIAQSTEV